MFVMFIWVCLYTTREIEFHTTTQQSCIFRNSFRDFINVCLGLSLDPVPDDVPDPVEGSDAPRPPDVALPHHRPRDEVQSRADVHGSRFPGEY